MAYRDDRLFVQSRYSLHIHINKADAIGLVLSAMVHKYNRGSDSLQSLHESADEFMKLAKHVMTIPGDDRFRNYGYLVIIDDLESLVVCTEMVR